MKIEKIKKLKSGKYKLEFDTNDSIILNEDVLLKYQILTHKEINSELLNLINTDNDYYECYNKAIKYCIQKIRSKDEIIKYLEKFSLSEVDKKNILDKLIENRFVNDLSYIKAFISDKINLSSDGPIKIKNDLLNKNLNETDIINELANYSNEIFEEKVKKIIDKKMKSNHKYSNYIFKQKMMMYLINLGYSKDMIMDELDHISLDNSCALEKEYKSLYLKLSKKFEDEKLFYEIKNRLVKKGFSYDEVNEITKKSS